MKEIKTIKQPINWTKICLNGEHWQDILINGECLNCGTTFIQEDEKRFGGMSDFDEDDKDFRDIEKADEEHDTPSAADYAGQF